jgi:hypothetical protein
VLDCTVQDNTTASELLATDAMKKFTTLLRFCNAVVVVSQEAYPPPRVHRSGTPTSSPTPVSPSLSSFVAWTPPPGSSGAAVADASPSVVASLSPVASPVSPRGSAVAGTLSRGHSLAAEMLREVHGELLESTLRPCLVHTSEVRARAATVFVHAVVAELRAAKVASPLLDALVSFLIAGCGAAGDVAASESAATPSPSPQPLLGVALRRLDCTNDELALASVGLVSEVVALNSPVVLHTLVVSHLEASASRLRAELPAWLVGDGACASSDITSSSAGVGTDSRHDDGVEVSSGDALADAEAWLRRVSQCCITGSAPVSVSDVALYAADAERDVLSSVLSLGGWEAALVAPAASESAAGQHSESVEKKGDEEGLPRCPLLEVARSGSLHRVVAPCIMLCGCVLCVCLSAALTCLCLQSLLRKLGCLLHQSTPLNLTITGVIARLAQSPNPLVHAYLFPKSADAPWTNVISTLQKV